MRKATIIALGLLAAAAANAQQVYRCGNEYSQKPCADGKAVTAEDSRTAAEAKKADAQTQRNAKLADAMEKDRVAQEKKVAGPSMVVTGQKPAAAASQAAASKPKSAKKKEKGKPAGDFTAVAPASPKK